MLVDGEVVVVVVDTGSSGTGSWTCADTNVACVATKAASTTTDRRGRGSDIGRGQARAGAAAGYDNVSSTEELQRGRRWRTATPAAT